MFDVEKFRVAPYKMESKSATLLAEKIGCLRIKREGSTYRGKVGDVILNWGAGSGVFNTSVGAATLWNPPRLIDVAVNKIKFFQAMEGRGCPRLPDWTTGENHALSWLEDGETVIARTKVEGKKGEGLVVIEKELDFVHAPLYTRRIRNVAEYRVYTFFDEVIDFRPKIGAPVNGMLVGDGIQFPPFQEWRDWGNHDACNQAVKAAKKLGLATCGFDVIWNGEKAYVLEANTAPYLGIQTAKAYATAIKEKLA